MAMELAAAEALRGSTARALAERLASRRQNKVSGSRPQNSAGSSATCHATTSCADSRHLRLPALCPDLLPWGIIVCRVLRCVLGRGPVSVLSRAE